MCVFGRYHRSDIEEFLNDLSRIESSFSDKEDIMETISFKQIWESTSLGFDCCGGDMMTPAYTVVVLTRENEYHVFFGGKFAYKVNHANEKFMEDLARREMASQSMARERYGL